MYFDRLDKRYALVKSNLHCDKVTQIGRAGLCTPTGLHSRVNFGVNRSHQSDLPYSYN